MPTLSASSRTAVARGHVRRLQGWRRAVLVALVTLGPLGCAARKSPEPESPPAATAPAAPEAESEAMPASEPTPAPAFAPPPQAPAPAAAARDEAAPTEAPSSVRHKRAAEPNFTTLQEAERAFAQAQSELERVALAESPTSDDKRPAAPRGSGASAGAAPKTASATSCALACRAFASLTRAADAICRLDGAGGERCTRAQRIVSDNRPRVARCACSDSEP